jgi:HD superfamily phosphohydrolase
MLTGYTNLQKVVEALDEYLQRTYPEYFGKDASHPVAPLKAFKVIHDNLWGTNRFSWRELAIIDSPLFQRLRSIHQTGLAHYVYPSAQHSRFEHSLGVVTVASRAFDALQQRNLRKFLDIGKVLDKENPDNALVRLREELRLAALLHDTGHSLYSHTSEIVYSEIPLLREAAQELGRFVGRRKGVGEVISFCLSRTAAIARLLCRAKDKLMDDDAKEEALDLDLENVSLLIVGRSKHPYLQFAADIISSDLDADKLDYLLRDATSAGLPLRYDLERYLYTVTIVEDKLQDGDGHLKRLFDATKTHVVRKNPDEGMRFPYYESYRLRLPEQAMSTVEQIVICKFMLYSYIYHHPKVRSAEGLLAKLLFRAVEHWRSRGQDDVSLLMQFLDLNDGSLECLEFKRSRDRQIAEYSERVRKRLIPRVVFDFVSSMGSHAQGELLKNFFSVLIDEPQKREPLKLRFEEIMGTEILRIDSRLGKDWMDALWRTGAWLDIPSAPKFENIGLLVGHAKDAKPLSAIFPIDYWIQAYEAHRYHVRVFAFSEFQDVVLRAARKACREVVMIDSKEFYEQAERKRT